MQTPEQLKVKLSLEEANLILSALGNLPYMQVYSLIHNLQNQVAPQIAVKEEEPGTGIPVSSNNGKESKIFVS